MSRKPPDSASDESDAPANGKSNLDLERGIDALNTLRVEMRKAGMTACADALDQAFAHCLQDYLSLRVETEGAPDEGENDNLN